MRETHRHSRSRRVRRGTGQSDGKYMFLAAVIMLAIVGVVTTIAILSPPSLSPATGCPQDTGHTERSIFVLLDKTDAVTATQRQHIVNAISGAALASEDYTRVKIFEILPSRQYLLSPTFDYCKPDADDPFGSPAVTMFHNERFRDNLEESLEGMQGNQPTSPIVHAIGSVAAQFAAAEGAITLIIASDFIEYSDLLNQYSPDWREQVTANQQRLYNAAPQLNGASVSMLFITRSGIEHHDQEFAAWWREYISQSGGRLVDQVLSDGNNAYHLFPFIPITE